MYGAESAGKKLSQDRIRRPFLRKRRTSPRSSTVTRSFFSGLAVIPYLGWTLGTLAGALLGNILPDSVMSALCIAIYGMFVAIIAPKAKKEKKLLGVVAVALAISCLFYYLPVLREISSGISISVCAVAAAAIGALVFPVKEDA